MSDNEFDPQPHFGQKIKNIFANIWQWIKKHKLASALILVGMAVLLAGIVAYTRYFAGPDATGLSGLGDKAKSQQKVTSPLDGTQTTAGLANRRPLAVMIENHPDARPQSGFDQASLIYEAVAEGGITRLMAVFGPHDAKEIGPIRSARTYFMEWAKEWDALYAYAGGTQDALGKIGGFNLNGLPHAENYFWRKAKAVASEHTLYSSTEKLYDYAKSKKYSLTADFEKRPFKKAGANEARPASQSVTVNFSDPLYATKWDYDPAANTYLRSMNGGPHKDASSGGQLAASNVVIQTMPMSAGDPVINNGKSWNIMPTAGEGKAVVLQDGKATTGKWKKASQFARTRFYTDTGVEIGFNPGLTWFQIIQPGQGSISGI